MLTISTTRRTVLLSAVAAAVATLGIAGSALQGSASTPVAAATVNPAQVYAVSTSSQSRVAGLVLQTATPAPVELGSSASISANGSAAVRAGLLPQAQPLPATPLAPQIAYMDFTAQGGQPTIVILPAHYTQAPDGNPSSVYLAAYTAERLDGSTWTVLPNGIMVTGDATAESDDLPQLAGHTYTYRICAHWFGDSRLSCSASTSLTTPTDMPLPQ